MKKTMMVLTAFITSYIVFAIGNGEVFAESKEPLVTQSAKIDQVIVTFKKGVKSELEGSDVKMIHALATEKIATLKVPKGETVEAYTKKLKARKDVKSVEPDYLVQLTYTPNDPAFSYYQYHHQNIETERAWDKTMGSSDVVVAVLDDGFDLNHRDLRDQIVSPHTTASTGFSVNDHGTHVAGIIGSSIDNNAFGAGVAPKTSIMPIDVFFSESAYISDVIEGIYYAVEAGADIINMSLGSYDYSNSYNNAVQYAYQNGLVIVAAAGNDSTDQTHYPSAYPNVISVGSTDSSNNSSYFSNFGKDIDLVAPGSSIYSTLPYDRMGAFSGTSMAAPVVAGVAALVLANEPQLANSEVEVRLLATTNDLGDYGKDNIYGNGLVNAKQALGIGAPPQETTRISGNSRYETAIAISQAGWATAETVVLATASDFPDALAGGPLAFKENAPILLTRTTSLTPETKTEIERLGAKKVIILGSKGAVSLEVEAALREMEVAIERIGGKNRFDTAALIADKLDSAEAILAYGFNFPDVLSVSAYAAKNGIPILLTRTDSLPAETSAALEAKSKTHVIGSTGAVSESVFNSLPNPVRYGGQNRYETGYVVNSQLQMGIDEAFIATGTNFPDALAGSVLAAKNNAPILLVQSDRIPEATAKQLDAYDSYAIFGGTGAVGEAVREQLNQRMNN